MQVLRASSGLRCVERGHGPAVVLLHPVAMRAEFWDSVADLLAADHRVLAFDLPGFGESRRAPRSYTLDAVSAEIVATAGEFGIASATFVGCSMGAMVAAGAALANPAIVSAVAVANAGLGLSKEGREVMRQRAEATREAFADTIEPTLERWFSPGFRASQPEKVALVRRWLRDNDPEAIALAWDAIAGLDYETRLSTMRAPLLVIAGELDPAAPPAVLKKIAHLSPFGSCVELPGAGHFAPVEQPHAFSAAIRLLTHRTARVAPRAGATS